MINIFVQQRINQYIFHAIQKQFQQLQNSIILQFLHLFLRLVLPVLYFGDVQLLNERHTRGYKILLVNNSFVYCIFLCLALVIRVFVK
jgi:hypothetical protein